MRKEPGHAHCSLDLLEADRLRRVFLPAPRVDEIVVLVLEEAHAHEQRVRADVLLGRHSASGSSTRGRFLPGALLSLAARA
jgi:hypothetical protein